MLKTSKKRKNLVSTINKVKTRFNKSEGAGARTLDLRIKSPLLYQLSYALFSWLCTRPVLSGNTKANVRPRNKPTSKHRPAKSLSNNALTVDKCSKSQNPEKPYLKFLNFPIFAFINGHRTRKSTANYQVFWNSILGANWNDRPVIQNKRPATNNQA